MKYSIAILTVLLLAACNRKYEVQPSKANIRITISHKVGNLPLSFNTLSYINKANEVYSIDKLEYYISNIGFYKDGQLMYNADTVAYVDASLNSYNFTLYNLPQFSFDSISYSIGVPPSFNDHSKLPSTYQNVAMEWPEIMGGGYHFLKLEGHWKDSATILGYALHLGTNACLVHGGCKILGNVATNQSNKLDLFMDVNEWFENPHTYSFNKDGTYTMGDMELMQKIKENGYDVLQVKP